MSDQTSSVDAIELFLSQLRSERAEHEAEVAKHEAIISDENAKIADLNKAIAVIEARHGPTKIIGQGEIPLDESEQPSQQADRDTDWQRFQPEALSAMCYGKGIADAAIAVLAAVGHQVSEVQLTEALKGGGVVFVGANPVNSLRFAMMRKAQETEVILETSPKVWGLASWPESSNPNASGFVVHRSKAAHMEASLRGLQAAKDRGVKLGRQPKITEAHAPKIQAMLDRKVPVKRIAAEFNVSAPGMTKMIARLRREGHLTGKG